MDTWQIWLIAGIILLILEMFTPALFFASVAIGCFFASLSAYLGYGHLTQTITVGITSILLIALVRPLIMVKRNNGNSKTGVYRYAGKTAKVIEHISNTQNTGRVKLFDEEWIARSANGNDIDVDKNVKIIELKDMVLYVENLED